MAGAGTGGGFGGTGKAAAKVKAKAKAPAKRPAGKSAGKKAGRALPMAAPRMGGQDQKFISILVLIVLVAVYLGYSDRIKAAWKVVRPPSGAPGGIPTVPGIPPIGSTVASTAPKPATPPANGGVTK